MSIQIREVSVKNLITVIFTLILGTFAHAEESIPLGISASLESKVMGEKRSYMIYLPPSYETTKDSFPVICPCLGCSCLRQCLIGFRGPLGFL